MVTYSDRPWTKSYDKGAKPTLNYPEITLQDFLKQTASRVPNSIALVTSAHLPVVGRLDKSVTFAELDRYSDALAAALVDMGLKKGDRVAIVMPNSVAFCISFYAILKAGGVVAATNPTYPDDKLAYQINDCDAEIVICLSLYYEQVKRVQSKTKAKKVIVANIKEYLPSLAKLLFTIAKEKKDGHFVAALKDGDVWFKDVLAKYAGQKSTVATTPNDLCLFQYTGGTTGVSKAAVSTHGALVANVLQQDSFLSVEGIPGEKEVMLGAIPMFHVFGMVAVLSTGVMKGCRIILVANAREIQEVAEVVHHYKPTLFHGVPALYNALCQNEDVKSGKLSLKSVRLCVSGSAPLPPATKREFEAISGGRLLEGFGMSECPTATHVNPVMGVNKEGSIGLPLPDVEARIVSLDDGKTPLKIGEPGELIIASPNVMVGYHNMPTETANVISENDGKRWMHTGDIAYMDDDGYFFIVDRKKDMALIGGFNVYPNNVEKVIKDHPAVLEVGVAAVPHPEKEGQEALKAWVVLKPNVTVTEAELIKHCEAHLAQYEIPRRISFIAELPKTAVGKTLRRELVMMELQARDKK